MPLAPPVMTATLPSSLSMGRVSLQRAPACSSTRAMASWPRAPRQGQRSPAVSVGEVHVGARGDERGQGVGMPGTAVTQDDGLDQRGPPQVVDVVERRAARISVRTTSAWPRWAAAISAVPSVAAGDAPGAGAEGQRGLQGAHVIGARRDGHDVVAITVGGALGSAPAATRARIAL